jgi:hypothetical protein
MYLSKGWRRLTDMAALVPSPSDEIGPAHAPPELTIAHTPDAPRRPRVSAMWRSIIAIFVIALVIAGWTAWRLRVQSFHPSIRTLLPRPEIAGSVVLLSLPTVTLTAEIATYGDELFAFLMSEHYREILAPEDVDVLLVFRRSGDQPQYRIIAKLPDEYLTGVAIVKRLELTGKLEADTWGLAPAGTFHSWERQTQLFRAAYNLPVRKKLETIPKKQLARYLQRFIRYKSVTDPRVRARLQPVPNPLSRDQASRLAGDIITVAEFYDLPIEFFLGIGAMENNYMNVRGDLNNSIWKRRPAPDDIVLERKRGRVRVLNDSAGVWQITRETLRYVHQLYQRDTRDYSKLPEHLRPPKQLQIQEVDPPVLTTYAGLLFRDLLDRFDGNVSLAVGAYNGGPGRPNMRYHKGVQTAADHARRVLEQAAVLNGESVVEIPWILPR